ncbi:hypothetical protein GPECTOR_52g19 [Gonium pectorale]|uniref:Uncharacterized protein n=1 Tax=Gonium pectorale TaxID=33097 RepID=A0A150G6X0_GONPE|nr:hypothetical protein GPECTOR_52g19 [Gonium pectorale]|eukprot:KXZ45616.1 hypothetical protein GPECTOR_52g19 [Gonium pectorale]
MEQDTPALAAVAVVTDTVTVTFSPAAEGSDARPRLPRSGACAAALPAWHPEEVIMVGGYKEDAAAAAAATTAAAGSGGGGDPAAAAAAAAAAPPPPVRGPTMEAWTFNSAGGGRWRQVQYAEGSPMPQPRLACQTAIVEDELWVMGGWDPSAPPPQPPDQPPPPPGSPSPFLNDVWALDRGWRWFAVAPLPGGRVLLHTHDCDDHVLLLEPARPESRAEAPEAPTGAAQGSRGVEEAVKEAEDERRHATLARVPVRGDASDACDPKGLLPPPPSMLPPLAAAAAPTAGGGGASALAAEPGSALYVYGGAAQSAPVYSDLWVLDPKALTWQQLAPDGPAPQARCSHVAGACGEGGRFLLAIGGSFRPEPGKPLQPLDDVVLYDTQANRWLEPLVCGPRPAARNAAVMEPLPRGPDGADRFLLHGGWRPFVQTYNDSYIVTVRVESAAGQAQA